MSRYTLISAPSASASRASRSAWFGSPAAIATRARIVSAHTGFDHIGYSVRQAAYDLRKLRGKQLIDKPSRSRRYVVSPLA
ncbi:MAG TPA: hypothetical protein VE197_11340, partial [Mycobacterium sp.]|nr:hypothetical protein [Mycobacterium sp.]